MAQTIPCLSLTEPWASLVATGAKTIETRSYPTDYRGPLGIHAAKGMTGDDLDMAEYVIREYGVLPAYRHYLTHRPKVKDAFAETRGRVLAVVTLVDCVPTRRVYVPEDADPDFVPGPEMVPISEQEYDMGGYGAGRWAWLLELVQVLPEPVPAVGALGLWAWRMPDAREAA